MNCAKMKCFFDASKQISEETLVQCHFNYMEESIPVALEELGAEFQQDWRGYLYACTSALLKEAREKLVIFKSFFICFISSPENEI